MESHSDPQNIEKDTLVPQHRQGGASCNTRPENHPQVDIHVAMRAAHAMMDSTPHAANYVLMYL